MNASTILVAIVFAAQIVVLSIVIPYLFHRASADLRRRFPPETHARLYPVPPGELRRYNRAIAVVRAVIVVVGVLLLVEGLIAHEGPVTLARTMLWIFMAQTVPAFLRLPQELRMVRAFRQMPAPSVRSADLRRLRVTDFVSPVTVVLGFAANVAAMLTAVALSQMPAMHVGNRVLWYLIIVSGIVLARMLYVTLTPMSIRRPDPYMSHEDVFNARRLRMRLLFVGGTCVGAFLTFSQLYRIGIETLQLNIVGFIVGTSLLCQLGYLLLVRAIVRAIGARDGSVYRLDAAQAPRT